MAENIETRISSEQAKDAIYKINKLSEKGLTPEQIADAIEKVSQISSSASEIDGSAKLAHPSVSKFLTCLNNNNKHISILVNSDSTGNETNEWVYLFAQWLATNYPVYTVRYRIWNTSTFDYDAPISINVGSGIYNLDIFNFAIGGTTPKYMLAKYFTKACKNIINQAIYPNTSTSVDLLIMNHGHNIYHRSKEQAEFMYADGLESILSIHNSCSVIGIKQNPLRDDNTAESKHNAVENYILKRGIALANVYSKFIKLNKIPSLYADNVHPSTGLGTQESPTGTRLFLESIIEHLSKTVIKSGLAFNSKFNLTKKNLLPNGDFSIWTTPTNPPDGWTCSYCTPSQDSINFENIAIQKSLKVVSNGTGSAFVEYIVPSYILNSVKGKFLTLSARMYINSANTDGNSGLIRVLTSSNSEIWTSAWTNAEFDAFVWSSIYFHLKETDTFLKIRIYTGVNSGAIVNIDRVVLGKGIELFDIQ